MPTMNINKTFFHVLYYKPNNTWEIKKDNLGTITAYDSKEDAIKKAMELAEELKGCPREIIVHKKNRTFEEVKCYH